MSLVEKIEQRRLTIDEASAMLGVNRVTLTRYVKHGCSGVRLKLTAIGWRRYVLLEDMEAFLEAINEPRGDSPPVTARSMSDEQKAAISAVAELGKSGW